jgi:hypothetical protein
MQASVDKARALELLDVEHAAVQALIDELSDEEMTRPNTIEYGLYAGQECSFKDLLAHLLTYEAYAIEAIDAWKRGEKHWISDAMRDPIQSRKVHFEGIDCRRANSLAETLDEWERTKSGLMQAIGALSDAEWRSPAPYATSEATDLGGMLEAILVAPPRPMYRHLPVHIPDSDAYVRGLRR